MDAAQFEQIGKEWLSQNAKRRYGLVVKLNLYHITWRVFLDRRDKFNWLYAVQDVPISIELLDLKLQQQKIRETVAYLMKAVERLFRRLKYMSRAERKQWRMKNRSAS